MHRFATRRAAVGPPRGETHQLRASAAAALIVASGVAPLHAGSISYGDFSDTPPGAVLYTGVSETSAAAPIFGPPTAIASTIDWNPGDFPASQFSASAGDGATDSIDGQLNFELTTLPGAGITSLLIEESGDFDLFGGGSAATQVGVGLFVEVEVLAVDRAPVFDLIGQAKIDVSASADAFFNLIADGPGLGTPWENALIVDLGAALSSAGITFTEGVTSASVTIKNSLVAIAEPLNEAEIVKTNFTVTPSGALSPMAIPEPPAAGLVGSLVALITTAAYARR
ncbi:MAG: hypothetical protein AAGB00_00060 [Planctomycetota bacterium]